ncbi:MAG: hypothetical protein CMJ83_17255 [Planctomycetes bacterium]|nr:hypothetical protein [Planctomycetota bacterium]
MNRIVAVVLALSVAVVAQDGASSDIKKLLGKHASSVVRVETVIEIDLGQIADMMGVDAIQKKTQEGVGVVVANGLIAVPSSVIAAEPPSFMMGPGGSEMEAERKSVHVISADGKKVAAKVSSESKDLGLSFLSVEGASGMSVINLGGKSSAQVGDQLIAIARAGKRFEHVVRIEKGYLSGERATKVGALQQGLRTAGCAVFDTSGSFVGVTRRVAPQRSEGMQLPMLMAASSNLPVVVVPASSIVKALPEGARRAAPTGPVSEAFESADANEDGSVSDKEFKAYASGRLQGQDDAFFARFFKLIDADKNGKLDSAEFEKRMEALGRMRNGGGGEGPEPPSKPDPKPERPRRGGRRRRPDPGPRDLEDKEGDYDKHARRAVKRDSFPVLDEPEMTSADKTEIEDDEAVIGVVCDGEARAYPIAVMGKHELANDICGHTPIAVSW